MATKTVGATGDYTNFGDYQSYLDALNTLTAAETGKIQSGEFDGGGLTLTGFTPSATYPYTLTCDDGAHFTANPLRYNDGARVLFNAGGECLNVAVPYVTIKGLAFKSVSGASAPVTTGSVDYVNIKDCIAECSVYNARTYNVAHYGTGIVENCVAVVRANQDSHYGHAFAAGYVGFTNCTAINVATSTSTNAGFGVTTNSILYNCLSYGFAVDYGSAHASSSHCATNKSSGTSTAPSTNAQYSVSSSDLEDVTSGSTDVRIKAGSTKLLDTGSSANGTTLDIVGNAVSGSARDIGAFEYQQASGQPASKRLGGFLHSHVNVARVGGVRRY